jgi:hypothetical protein
MSPWAFLQFYSTAILFFLVNPFSGLLYKKGGVFCFNGLPLKITFSGMPTADIRHLAVIGMLLEY